MIYPFLILWVVALVWWGVRRIHPKLERFALQIVRKHYRKSNYMTLIVTAISLTIICIIALVFVTDKGGLIGSAIGGIGTLIAVLVTIKSNEDQQEKGKESIHRPYFTIIRVSATFTNMLSGGLRESVRDAEPPEIEDCWLVSYPQQPNIWKYKCTLRITLSNMGVGPAIHLQRSILKGITLESFPARDVPPDGTHDLYYTFETSYNPLDDKLTEEPARERLEFSYHSIVDCEFWQSSHISVDFVFDNNSSRKIVVKITPLSPQRVIHR